LGKPSPEAAAVAKDGTAAVAVVAVVLAVVAVAF
jgi:hypothetical protein